MQIKEVGELYQIKEETLRYYEKVGMIPPVTRDKNGVRHYSSEDLGWVELSLCMRKAGLPIQAIVEFVKLCQEGEDTLGKRILLLKEQKEHLEGERKNIDAMLERLSKKIALYEKQVDKHS